MLVLVAVAVGTVGSPESEGLAFELRKYLIQLLLITALGAVVALLAYEYRAMREASDRGRQYTIDSIASVLGQLDAIYRKVKRTRRLLRLSHSRGLNRQAYTDAMLELDEEQQDLEQLSGEIAVLVRRLPELGRTSASDLGVIAEAVESMEGYLRPLWREYEDVAAMSDDDFRQADLKKLGAFVLRAGGDFYQFSANYHNARKRLIGLLADSRIGRLPITASEP